jgi:predicted glycosyltransferase
MVLKLMFLVLLLAGTLLILSLYLYTKGKMYHSLNTIYQLQKITHLEKDRGQGFPNPFCIAWCKMRGKG